MWHGDLIPSAAVAYAQPSDTGLCSLAVCSFTPLAEVPHNTPLRSSVSSHLVHQCLHLYPASYTLAVSPVMIYLVAFAPSTVGDGAQ